MTVAQSPSPQTPDRQHATTYLRLIGLGAAIGIPAALLAAGFLGAEHQLQHWLWSDLPHQLGLAQAPWYMVIGLPVVGAAIVILTRRLLPGDGGHPPLEGIGGGPVPLANAPGIALAALGTLSFGAALGPEAPLIALGSVAGVAFARLAHLDRRQSTVLSSAGSFSAVSALFGGPIVGGLLMLEEGLSFGAALLPMLIPGFTAAAIGYVLFVGLGSWPGLPVHGLKVPGLPLYSGTHLLDLVLAIVVGLLSALLIATVRSLGRRVEVHGVQPLHMPGLLLAGGLAVGLIAQIAAWLGANAQDVLFSGQSGLPALDAAPSTKIVLILLLGKAAAYAVSLGCGYRGGPVFPAIFLGVAVATLGVQWFGISPTLAVAIGTAAGMAATSKLILTPIVFAALLVGHNGVDTVPATVLAAVASWLTIRYLQQRSEAAAKQPT
jgi:H+/Cl- antiporter ClcA